MADYTIVKREDAEDVLGDYPGEMRMLTGPLGAEQVALTWRRMPQHTGGKGGYGHRHKSQEELYLVLKGVLQFKLGDDVVDVPAGCAVRVPARTGGPGWDDRGKDPEAGLCSVRADGPQSER